jgi:putative PIN family toxin of toxin-antitoxin system
MSNAPSQLRRIVVDINLFVSGLISPLGQPHQLITHFRQDAFLLLISEQLRAELEEVLRRERLAVRFGLTEEDRNNFLLLVDTKSVRVNPRARLPVSVRDPKDEIVLATALGGRADYLVTGDDDLLVLNGHPRIGTLQIVTVRSFLEQLSE